MSEGDCCGQVEEESAIKPTGEQAAGRLCSTQETGKHSEHYPGTKVRKGTPKDTEADKLSKHTGSEWVESRG